MGPRSLLRRVHTDEAGQSVVIVALAFTLLLGFAGLAIDGGRYYAERRFLQNAVDAAALGCVAKLTQGGVTAQADAVAQGKTILRNYNLQNDPTGTGVVVSETPVYTTWFNGLGEADKRNLADGVYAGQIDCRVAVQASMQTLFIRLFGLQAISVPANAHAMAKGGMLPVVVNRYKDPPGPSSTFIDYTKQEVFQSSNPSTCFENGGRVGGGTCPDAEPGVYTVTGGVITCSSCLWGPETVVAGQGYQSSDSDFRGFIALDIRDFTNENHLFYNGVTATTNANQLKDQEASYVNGGYPGPDLEPYVPTSNPVQAGLQIATLSGNSAGVVVTNFDKYFEVGERILVQLFDGQVREIPEFTINAPSVINATANGVSGNGPTFRVGANQRFRDAGDRVTLQMVRDTFNLADSDTPVQLQDFHLDPGSEPSPPYAGRFTPAGGSGTQVQIRDLQVNSGLASGIYSVIIQGVGYQPDGTQLSTKKSWVPLNVGGVTRDFEMKFASTLTEVALGDPSATYTFELSTGSASAAWGNSSVAFAADRGTCAIGNVALVNVVIGQPVVCVTATVSPSSAVPSKNSPPTVTVTVPTASVAQGTYQLVVRGRGTNSDGQPVVHVQQLTLGVGTVLGGTTKYVNVQGYVVFVITSVTANTVSGRATTGFYADPHDPVLNIAHRPGLIPWEVAPY